MGQVAADLTFKSEDGKRLPCRPGPQRTEYRESASGLRLRITQGGGRAWYVVYWSTTAKTARRLRLGDATTMPLSEARAAARRALTAVDQARDPYAERLAEREREREARTHRAEERRQGAAARLRRSLTVAKLCREYIEHRRTIPSGRYGRIARPQTIYLWESMLRLHVEPVVGGHAVESLEAEDVVGVLEGAVKRAGPVMGPRVRDFLSSVWRWADQRQKSLGVRLPPISFAALPKVGAVQQERERVLTPAEIWRFWRATEEEGPMGEALRFMLLTGGRVREATKLPWSEVDLSAKLWRLPAARNKVGRDREIPLSEQALAVLRRVRHDGERVFVARSHEGPVGRVRARMGGPHWEARDLRRTAATLCARLGADPFVVALVLGHTRPDSRTPAVTAVYLRWDYAEKVREALTRLGSWVEDTVTRTTEPGDVVSIELRR